jgi:hypothetical protein
MDISRKLSVIFIALLMSSLWGAGLVTPVRAADGPWTTPVNVSISGAATLPVSAVTPDGTLHILWWDSVNGEQYASLPVTATQALGRVTIPDLYGDRIATIDPRTQKTSVALVPPSEVRMVVDSAGAVSVFWLDTRAQLLTAQLAGEQLSRPEVLADFVLLFDVAADTAGRLHAAYIRTDENQNLAAGVLYQTWDGRAWSSPALVSASRYFRSVKADSVSISVAGTGDAAVIGWDDPRQGHAVFATSADGGKTWTEAQSITETSTAVQIRVAVAPNSEFMMLWRDPNAGACVLNQRRSNDGMKTWSPPVRVLGELARCPQRWSFVPGDNGLLWLLGMPAVTAQTGGQRQFDSAGISAAWNNQAWTSPAQLSLSFVDATLSQTVSLGCVNLALARQTLALIGCDSHGDVWAVHNRLPLEQISAAVAPIWPRVDMLAPNNSAGRTGDLLGDVATGAALVGDQQGQMYALWSQTVLATQPFISLYIAIWDGQSWSPATRVLDTPLGLNVDARATAFASQAVQPSLALDGANRLHAVWASGPAGLIYYSRATARNAIASQEWTQPVALPMPTRIGSAPYIVIDARSNTLIVVYAVPYNEQRGLYTVRSSDGGATWSAPVMIVDAAQAGWFSVDKPRAALDAANNTLHVTWVRVDGPSGNAAQAIYYARSNNEGQAWTAPVKVAEGRVDWSRISTGSANQVFMAWHVARSGAEVNAEAPFEVWSSVSPDGGQRWSDPARVAGLEQVSGPADIEADQDGVIYYAGIGRSATGESSLVYARQAGQTQNDRDAYSLGQPARVGAVAALTLLPGQRQVGVLARSWVAQRDGTGVFGLLAALRTVSATISIAPLPTFTPLPAVTVEPTLTPSPTGTPKPELTQSNFTQPTPNAAQGQPTVLISAVLALLLVVGAVSFILIRQANH